LQQIENNAKFAATVAPLWFGNYIPGLPIYTGGNPYNIHGVDHKYDYLLNPDQKYMANKRDLILYIAISKNPVIPAEQDIYNASELSNILKKKLSKEAKKTGNNTEVKKETLDKTNTEILKEKVEKEETPVVMPSQNKKEEVAQETPTIDSIVEKIDKKIAELEEKERLEKTNITTQSEINDKTEQFRQLYNILVSGFNEYKAKGDNGIYDPEKAQELLDIDYYLQRQLPLLANTISEREYNEYFKTLKSYERLEEHIAALNSALSVFNR